MWWDQCVYITVDCRDRENTSTVIELRRKEKLDEYVGHRRRTHQVEQEGVSCSAQTCTLRVTSPNNLFGLFPSSPPEELGKPTAAILIFPRRSYRVLTHGPLLLTHFLPEGRKRCSRSNYKVQTMFLPHFLVPIPSKSIPSYYQLPF